VHIHIAFLGNLFFTATRCVLTVAQWERGRGEGIKKPPESEAFFMHIRRKY